MILGFRVRVKRRPTKKTHNALTSQFSGVWNAEKVEEFRSLSSFQSDRVVPDSVYAWSTGHGVVGLG